MYKLSLVLNAEGISQSPILWYRCCTSQVELVGTHQHGIDDAKNGDHWCDNMDIDAAN